MQSSCKRPRRRRFPLQALSQVATVARACDALPCDDPNNARKSSET